MAQRWIVQFRRPPEFDLSEPGNDPVALGPVCMCHGKLIAVAHSIYQLQMIVAFSFIG